MLTLQVYAATDLVVTVLLLKAAENGVKYFEQELSPYDYAFILTLKSFVVSLASQKNLTNSIGEIIHKILEEKYNGTNIGHWRSSHYAQYTHVRNKNSNTQGSSTNVVNLIFHTLRNCS